MEIEFKGTKGKWVVYQKDQVICDGSTVGDFENLLRPHKERQANALLFLKSREMLEMLKELINLYELGHEIGQLGQYDKAKQLIKEATTI